MKEFSSTKAQTITPMFLHNLIINSMKKLIKEMQTNIFKIQKDIGDRSKLIQPEAA